MRIILLALSLVLATGSLTTGPAGVILSDPDTGDWPMWGGTPDRNMVSHMVVQERNGCRLEA